jgi:enterochelin esterase-like enzyme
MPCTRMSQASHANFQCSISRMRLLLVLLVSLPLFAQDLSTRIEPGHTYQRSVPIGQPDVVRFQILSAEQIVSLKIASQTDGELVCRFYAPSGEFRRAFSIKVHPNPTLKFFAAEAGDWRLEISSPAPVATPAPYVLSDLQFHPVTLAEPRPSDIFESPRLSTIHSPADVAAFWKEMQVVGTPLIEAIPGEPDERLVTFVWRGSPDTKSVYVQLNWEVENRRLSQLRDTGVWYLSLRIDRRVRTMYQFAPNLPPPSRMAEDAVQVLLQRDPLNPKINGAIKGSPDNPLHQGQSVLEMPDAPPQPWIVTHPDTPKGEVLFRRFESKVLGNTRNIWMYSPPDFQPTGKPYPLLVLSDGGIRAREMDTPTALDNLIAAKRVPPLLAVMISNPSDETRFRELGDGPAFTEFLTTELIPWARKEYNATADPRQTIIGGASLGGFAAFYAALLHPEIFGNVISQSGTLNWAPLFARGKDAGIDYNIGQNWLEEQIIKSPVLPIRFYIEAGSMERFRNGEGILVSARRMRDVLRARGYPVLYNEFNGAHDDVVWRETFAEALIRLLDPVR